jgi:hypothetical protein
LTSQGQGYKEDLSFLFLKGGQFRISIQFSGAGFDLGSDEDYIQVLVTVGNRLVTFIRNIPSVYDPDTNRNTVAQNYKFNISFTASPGELMTFNMDNAAAFPQLNYGFSIESVSADVPYVGSKVVSNPFTLTVNP